MPHCSNPPTELNELRDLSIHLGRNPLLVQASTGNISWKLGDSLWIKASGKRLVDAEADDFLVCVNLSVARHSLVNGGNTLEAVVISGRGRPSIETAMHAILPQRVVVHVHSVSTIAWAVRQDAPDQLRTRLEGLNWAWVPYTPSGIPLARKIRAVAASTPQTDVFVLGNHGLVVCGPSCRSAERLLTEVEARLAIVPRPAPQTQLALLQQAAAANRGVLPERMEAHALATDEASRRIVCGGILYPCQAMFLPNITELPAQHRWPDFVLLIPGLGVLCRNQLSAAQEHILGGLAAVVQRLPASASIRYLTAAEISELLMGPAYADVPDRTQERSNGDLNYSEIY